MKTSVPRPRPEAMDTVDKNVITLWEKQLYKGEATIKAKMNELMLGFDRLLAWQVGPFPR